MITYVLAKRNTPSEMGYENVHYPKTYTLPAIADVSVFDPEKREYVRRRVRYCPGEKSIFMDEQDPNSRIDKKDLSFVDGVLTINQKSKPNLAAYLAILDANGSKKDRDTGYSIKYKRFDVDVRYEEELKREERTAETMSIFMELPLEKKRAISHMMGKNTVGKSDARWTYELLASINSSEDTRAAFLDHLKDPFVETVEVIGKAEVYEMASFQDFTWKINGVRVLNVDRTRNPYMALAEFLAKNPETYYGLKRSIQGVDEDIVEEEGVYVEEQSAFEKPIDVTERSAEYIFDKCKEKGILKFYPGKGYEVVETEQLIGKSKNRSVREIEKVESLRNYLIKKLD